MKKVLEKEKNAKVTFKSMGLDEVLLDACSLLKWRKPTQIQEEAIPVVLKGKDIIGLAETGSGKTGAFALPILHRLLEEKSRHFALILTPTRELAQQICEQFDQLGKAIQLKTAMLVGGMDMQDQTNILRSRPHVIIATPGRLLDHLKNTKFFKLDKLQCLVLDEADKILNMDFDFAVDKILSIIPKKRQTLLFSATMTQKVQELQKARLKDPVKLEPSLGKLTVDKLQQYMIFVPFKHKDQHLAVLAGKTNSAIIFCSTVRTCELLSRMLLQLNLPCLTIHGKMSQRQRFQSLKRFREGQRSLLVATDVAARGLDIPHVDAVINYDLPTNYKEYVHRVGRTARAGKAGKAFTIVTQNDVHDYLKLEAGMGMKLEAMEQDERSVMALKESVCQAREVAKRQIVEIDKKKKRQIKEGRLKREREEVEGNGGGEEEEQEEEETYSGDDEDKASNKKKKKLKKNKKKKF